jgi:hypothetical protein
LSEGAARPTDAPRRGTGAAAGFLCLGQHGQYMGSKRPFASIGRR